MGKTRDLFKKIRHTKGTFQAKMGTIKDRNGVGLTEAEYIKKRWQDIKKRVVTGQVLCPWHDLSHSWLPVLFLLTV